MIFRWNHVCKRLGNTGHKIVCDSCGASVPSERIFQITSVDPRRGLYCPSCTGIIASYVAKDINTKVKKGFIYGLYIFASLIVLYIGYNINWYG